MNKKLDLAKEIERYIDSKKSAWSPSTLNSEKYRLRGVTQEQLADPAALFAYLKDERKLKAYPLKTAFIRAGELVDFLMSEGKIPQGVNAVKLYMRENANAFKHAYAKKAVDVTFEEAAERINKMENEELRKKALQLLYTGMRYAESLTLNSENQVVGKGGWHREVPMAKDVPADGYEASYTTLYRHLKKLGLTPHMLRKLCATKLVELGAQEADLMKIMGWRSSQMASIYVQAKRERSLMTELKKELTNGKQVSGKVSKNK